MAAESGWRVWLAKGAALWGWLLRSKKGRLAALGVLLALGAGLALGLRQAKEQPLALVKRGEVVEAVYGIGSLLPAREFELKLGVTGTLAQVRVAEGEAVRKGQPLLRLDGMETFAAPFDGTITLLPYHAGENVFPQLPILILTDLSSLYVKVVLDQDGAVKVRRGQEARISFSGLAGQRFNGRVEAIYPNENQFAVHLKVDELPSTVLPGMTADVAIVRARRANALLVPVAAVSRAKTVRVQRAGRRLELAVKLGSVDGDWAEVVEGDLRTGDQPLLPQQ